MKSSIKVALGYCLLGPIYAFSRGYWKHSVAWIALLCVNMTLAVYWNSNDLLAQYMGCLLTISIAVSMTQYEIKTSTLENKTPWKKIIISIVSFLSLCFVGGFAWAWYLDVM